MALTSDRERKICKKYSKQDNDGKVHCFECPLVKDERSMMCKAFTHYDKHLREWVVDEENSNG